MKNKTCLVIQGGGFRGIHSLAMLKVMKEAKIEFDCYLGISSGALNAAAYLSNQLDRAVDISLNHTHSLGMTVDTANTIFSIMFKGIENEIEPFDFESFMLHPSKYYAGICNCLNLNLEHLEKSDQNNILKAIVASASLPLISPFVSINDLMYCDGGVAAPVSIDFALATGASKIVVISTRERGFKLAPTKEKIMGLIKANYGEKYPRIVDAYQEADQRYNQTMSFVEDLEKREKIFLLAPQAELNIPLNNQDPSLVKAGYKSGLKDINREIDNLINYLEL